MDRPKGILKETHPTTNGPPTFSSTYVVLPLSLPPQRAFPRPATHYLYLRRDAPPQTSPANAPRHDDDDEDALGKTEDEDGVTRRRSLFAANVPVDASEAALRALFARLDPAARVERVEFEGERRPPSASALDHGRGGKKRRRPHDEEEEEEDGDEGGLDLLPSTWSFRAKKPGGAAVLVFVDAAAAAAGLRAAKRRARAGSGTPAVEWRGTDDETGVRRYESHQSLTYPARAPLQALINGFLARHDARAAAREARLKRLRGVPDADGFVTVLSGAGQRRAPAKLADAQAAAERLREREKKRIGGAAFYRFQVRERAKKKEREVRGRFEEDVERLREMRRRRGAVRPE